MLFQDSRRAARINPDGELVLLADQDRVLWDEGLIAEGPRVLERALALRRPGPYQLQAVIAAAHARGGDWETIVRAYDQLLEFQPSPVIRLNRAVAVALAGDIEDGLVEIDAISELDGYHLYHSARADLLRRLDRREEATLEYRRAAELTENEAERRFFARRLRELAQD